MGALFFAHFVNAVTDTVGVAAYLRRLVHQILLDILVVDAQDAPIAGVGIQFAVLVQAKEVHAVMVIAGAMIPLRSRFAAHFGIIAQVRAHRVPVSV